MLSNDEVSSPTVTTASRWLMRGGAGFALAISLVGLSACSSGADTAAVESTADVAVESDTAAEGDAAGSDTANSDATDSGAAAGDAVDDGAAEVEEERPAPPTDIEVPEFDDRKKPVVPFSGEPLTELGIEDVIVGEGAEAVSGSFVNVHYVGVLNSNGEQFDASWDRGSPFSFGLGGGQVISGWDEGVVGMREGGRRILRIPAAQAYGDGGSGIITPGSDLVFTVDLATVTTPADPADEPTLTVPDELSGSLEIEDLVEGTGPAAAEGDAIQMNFTSILASTGETFVSSWQQGGLPADFIAGEPSGMPGFDQALIGAKAGGTRKVIIPPDQAFGAEGIPGQVEPDETIIVQFDVLSVTPAAG